MSETRESIIRQIAELEASLDQPIPEILRPMIVQQLATLRQQFAAYDTRNGIVGTTNVSGTLHGAAVGVNLGTITIASGGAAPAPAQGHAEQASPEQITAQRERLSVHRATLATLLTQQATLSSAYAPPGIAHGIREARVGIAACKTALRGWGVAVEDGPDDGT